MKRIVLIGTLLLLFVLTAGTASARIILPPGWPFLPPIITPPVVEAAPPAYYPNTYGYDSYPNTYGYSYPYPYGYYSYPYGYYGYRRPGYWGYGGRGYYGYRGYGSYGGGGYSRSPGHGGHGGYRR